MCGVCVVYVWCVWCMCGVCVVYVRFMCGVCVVCVCGVCVVYVVCVCGVCVVSGHKLTKPSAPSRVCTILFMGCRGSNPVYGSKIRHSELTCLTSRLVSQQTLAIPCNNGHQHNTHT